MYKPWRLVHNSCRGRYISIERAGTGGRGKRGEWGGRDVKHWGSRVLSPYCVLRCSSLIEEEAAVVRDCCGIGRIGVICKFGIIEYSVSGAF
jgi:hypothetical protein